MTLTMTEDELTLAIIQSLKNNRKKPFQDCMNELQPSDIAQQYLHLPVKHQPKFLLFLSKEQLEELIKELNKEDQLDIDGVIEEDNEESSSSDKAIDLNTKPLTAAYRRLPWLILLLFIGVVSGSIIDGFSMTLEKVVALAFFMPMIAGMTGNTGTQSLAVVVRELETQDLDIKKTIKLIVRELWVGIIIGAACGILLLIVAFVWQGSYTLGIVVGGSLLLTLIIGTLVGTIIPLILHKFKVDPAIASGPLITTINDILSLFIYFGIATLFLSKLM